VEGCTGGVLKSRCNGIEENPKDKERERGEEKKKRTQ
jgi:hypothetical protein